MVKLEIHTSNAAFDDGMTTEITRLLRAVITEVERGTETGMLYDSNGNQVGTWKLA